MILYRRHWNIDILFLNYRTITKKNLSIFFVDFEKSEFSKFWASIALPWEGAWSVRKFVHSFIIINIIYGSCARWKSNEKLRLSRTQYLISPSPSVIPTKHHHYTSFLLARGIKKKFNFLVYVTPQDIPGFPQKNSVHSVQPFGRL